MKSADVIPILESMAADQEQALGIDQVHALYFAVGIIRSLPPSSINLIDALFDLAFPEPHPN